MILTNDTMIDGCRCGLKLCRKNIKRPYKPFLKILYPLTSNLKEIESLFLALGAEISERAGSRIAVVLNGQVMVFHRPHPSPNTDKGAVVSIRKWLDVMGIHPSDDHNTQQETKNDEQSNDDQQS